MKFIYTAWKLSLTVCFVYICVVLMLPWHLRHVEAFSDSLFCLYMCRHDVDLAFTPCGSFLWQFVLSIKVPVWCWLGIYTVWKLSLTVCFVYICAVMMLTWHLHRVEALSGSLFCLCMCRYDVDLCQNQHTIIIMFRGISRYLDIDRLTTVASSDRHLKGSFWGHPGLSVGWVLYMIYKRKTS